MQIIHNAISDELNEKIVIFIYDALQRPQWVASQFYWGVGLIRGILGDSLSTNNIPTDLKNQIIDELRPYLPSTRNIDIGLNVWPPLSALNWHTDEKYNYGATLYLNDNWYREWGGLFLYECKKSNQILGVVPEKNLLVINNNSEPHAVTPIATEIEFPRLSVQIFQKSDEENN